MKKKLNEIISFIKELYKSPKGKAVLFFGFYFVFFAVLLIFLRLAPKKRIDHIDYQKGTPYNYSLDYFDLDNFTFTYNINLDDTTYSYVGKHKDDVDLFQFNNMSYYRNQDNFFVKNDLWIKSENPFKFYDFIDLKKVDLLLSSSAYDSKTTYSSGKTNYVFLISTNTINKLIHNVDTDFFEEPNRLILITDENNNVKEIKFELDSYCTLNKICTKNLVIDLEFDMFGKVDKIDNPINE